MGYKVTITGTKAGFASHVASLIKAHSDTQIGLIANKTAEVMQNKVRDSIGRADSSGALESSIYAEKIANGAWGVGKIPYMNNVVPYWNHVDKGSVAVGAAHSHRVPVGGFNPGFTPPVTGGNGQRWFVAQGGSSFIPTKPIQPLNYIAKTLAEINLIIASVRSTN